MGQIETIAIVNNEAFKTITSKKTGKTYTLAQATTDQNHVIEIFPPIKQGDKVEVEWDASYSTWKAKKVNEQANAQMDALRKVYEVTAATYKAVTGEEYGVPVIQTKPAPKAPTAAELPPEHIEATTITDDDMNVDINSIPF